GGGAVGGWGLEGGGELGGPLLRAVLDVDGDQVLGLAAGAHGVERPADDGHPGVAAAGVLVHPQPLRAALGPLPEQPGFLGDVGAVRPAPLRPAVGQGTGGREADEAQREELVHVPSRGVGDTPTSYWSTTR